MKLTKVIDESNSTYSQVINNLNPKLSFLWEW